LITKEPFEEVGEAKKKVKKKRTTTSIQNKTTNKTNTTTVITIRSGLHATEGKEKKEKKSTTKQNKVDLSFYKINIDAMYYFSFTVL
jgi:hypothetical protein